MIVQSDRFLRLKELSTMFGVTQRTLWNWERLGRIVLVSLSPRVKGMWEADARAWSSFPAKDGRQRGQPR